MPSCDCSTSTLCQERNTNIRKCAPQGCPSGRRTRIPIPVNMFLSPPIFSSYTVDSGALSNRNGVRGTGVLDKRPCADQRSHVFADHGSSGGRGLMFAMVRVRVLVTTATLNGVSDTSARSLRGQVIIGAQRFEHLNIRHSFLSPRTHFCHLVLISQSPLHMCNKN